MVDLRGVPPETAAKIQAAIPLLEESNRRSPTGLTVEQLIMEALGGNAQLWLGAQSVAMTQFVRTARVTMDNQIFAAGGDLQELLTLLEQAAATVKQAGCDRLVIEDTRKGWAKHLRPIGFTHMQGLVKTL